jgi:hypothetical protein
LEIIMKRLSEADMLAVDGGDGVGCALATAGYVLSWVGAVGAAATGGATLGLWIAGHFIATAGAVYGCAT